MCCLLWNPKSLQNKVDDFIALLEDEDIDIAAVVETWMPCQHNNVTAQLKESNYEIQHYNRDRDIRRGGGVALIYRNNFKLFKSKIYKFQTFECIQVSISCRNSSQMNFVVVYRFCEIPPSQFLSEFYNFIDNIFINLKSFIILGDFNLHVNEKMNPTITQFQDILATFSLTQFVDGPTHELGNTLDLVIGNSCDTNIKNLRIDFNNRSDHAYIFFNITNTVELTSTKSVLRKNFKSMNTDNFKCDIANKVDNYVSNIDGADFSEALSNFNELCSVCINDHVETKKVNIPSKAKPKWMDSQFRKSRAERRRLYKRWARTQCPIDRKNFENSRINTQNLSIEKQTEYFASAIESCNNSHKELSRLCKSLMDTSKSRVLPSYHSPEVMATHFNDYFIGKIVKIRSSFEGSGDRNPQQRCGNGMDTYEGTVMTDFQPISQEDLKKIILSKPIKTSPEDPLPAILFKSCVNEILPALTRLVNLSLSTGSLDGLKDSVVTPILKKAGLDPEVLKNYRPVSNIAYISKLIERAALVQADDHMDSINAHIPNQSGYKPKHSCETLLLRVINDILLNMDDLTCTIMLLLDLSAAFDTVDHDELLDMLWHELGFRGNVYNWFVEFLRDRRQAVNIDGHKSSFKDNKFGVPQGSVMGPFLFNIYVRNLIKTMEQMGFTIHGYADDHQILFSFKIDFQVAAIRRTIPHCLNFIGNWMNRHFLKLNPSKSQVIIFYPKAHSGQLVFDNLMLMDGSSIEITQQVYNLGVTFDSPLTFSPHITSTISQGYNLIRDVVGIRRYLSLEHLKTLVNSIIIGKVDNCNSLLYGISAYDRDRLQKFQNSCARTIYRKKKYDHVSGILKELHWLPSEARTYFKILCYVYKCIHDLAPSYLSELITIKRSHNLSLAIPRCRTQVGDRAFKCAGPRLWNALPVEVRMLGTLDRFKARLKHHLFTNFQQYKMQIGIYRT